MSGAKEQKRPLMRLLVVLGSVAFGCEHETMGPRSDGAVLISALKFDNAGWSQAVRMEQFPPGADPSFNTPSLDGCPFISRDGKTFYMASNRPGGLGGTDIWVSTRESVEDPWGPPVNVGQPVNSSANDFCPTIARDGHLFYFVSNRAGGCGGDDIYVTRLRDDKGYEQPENLGCQLNSAANEASPFPLAQPRSGPVLYFSSFRAGGFALDAPGATAGDADIYVSEWHAGAFGAPTLVRGVNSMSNDGQPNVRRDGLEIFFFSNRSGTLGSNDIYSAMRARASDEWSTPINLGPRVNSDSAETRPSLSWDGMTLYFGSTRVGGGAEGSTDIYVTRRQRLTGADK